MKDKAAVGFQGPEKNGALDIDGDLTRRHAF